MRNILLNKTKLVFSCLFLIPIILFGQQDDKQMPGIFEHLLETDVADITITLDLDTLLGDRRRTDYVPGTFTIQKKKKAAVNIPVRVRPRGKFRRMKCNFPPLKLKFRKNDLAEQGLNSFNEFKLVTQCLEDDRLAREMIMKEYLAYKLYSELTPYSFRVQLVRVTYKHITGSRRIRQWGIIIEDLGDLARRTGSTVVSRMGIPLDSLHSNQEKLASLFQYMIGNCDWSYILARNMEFVQLPDGKIMPVPYDFDYCGFVNAPYSAPNVQLGQKTVKDRVYLGNASSKEEITVMFRFFKSKEKTLLKAVNDCKHLNIEVRAELEAYLKEFFQLIKDEEKAAAVLFGS